MLITRRTVLLGAALPALVRAQAHAPEGYPVVPYIPTPYEVVEEMLKLAGVRANDVVYDLGSGEGRIVIMAAEKFRARAVGVELNRELIREARESAAKAGVSRRVRFIEADLFKTDLRSATVVTLYLLPDVIEKLKPKLRRELRPGSRVVSFFFDMGDWRPDRTATVNGRPIYVWIIANTHTHTRLKA